MFWADHQPWLNTSLRTVLAVFGGYALAAYGAAVLSVTLPLARPDAAMAAIMAGFLIYLLAILWTFAAASLLRAVLGLILSFVVPAIWIGFVQMGGAA